MKRSTPIIVYAMNAGRLTGHKESFVSIALLAPWTLMLLCSRMIMKGYESLVSVLSL